MADSPNARSPLEVANLNGLMELTIGRPEVGIALIDGPVAANHADLATENVRSLSSPQAVQSARINTEARAHGTYVAGIVSARRGSIAPAICPGCTLFVRPIFLEPPHTNTDMPSASPEELADAIVECVGAGARILNLSVALAAPSPNKESKLEQALSYAGVRGAIIVAAAGNQGTVGSSAITRHPWVLPVVACSAQGHPMALSNLGRTIARRGLMAPGDGITSLGADGTPMTSGGTSAAAPFVTGTIALLLSIFPEASATQAKLAITRVDIRRGTIVPPLLDAGVAYQLMVNQRKRA
jgi:subtilisin family serine protease